MVWEISNLVILSPIKKLFVKDVVGIENIPDKSSFIIASNHASYLDSIIIAKIIYDKFKQKTHYVSHPGRYGRKLPEFVYVKCAGCIPIDVPEEEFFANVKNTLKNNKIVAIFPEGRYTKDGDIKHFKSGIGRMALESFVPILPIVIKGTFEVCPGPKLIPKFKKIVKVVIGKPIDPNVFAKEKNAENYLRIALKVENEVKKLFKS